MATSDKKRGFNALSSAISNIKSKSQGILKKTKIFSVNDKPKIQGEATIGISPFDDYFLFNVYTENNGKDIPLDLRSVGDLYLSFFDTSDEVSIRNVKNIDGIDPALGQVVFKINKSQSKKILSFADNRFYISSKLQIGTDSSDETIIYTGKFSEFSSQRREDFETIAERNLTEVRTLAENLQTLNDELVAQINDLKKDIVNLTSINNNLRTSNNNLTQRIEDLKQSLGQEKSARIEAEADEAKAKDLQKKSEEQVKKLKSSVGTSETRQMSTKELENTNKQKNQKTSKTFKSGDNTRKQSKRD